jgi:PAS domain S-box-containing protein
MRTAILLVLATAVLPSLVLQVGIYYYWFRSSVEDAQRDNLELSRSLAGTFEAYVRDLGQHEATLASIFTEKGLATPGEMEPFLRPSAAEYPALNAFLFVDLQGRITASSDRRLVGIDVKDRRYFQEASRTKRYFLSDLLEGRADPNPIFVVARGVYKNDNLLGVIAASVDPGRLGAATLKVPRSGQAGISFFDRRGVLVYRYPSIPLTWDARTSAESGDVLKRALAGSEAKGELRFSGDSEHRLGARVPIAGTGWVAGADEQVREVTAGPLKALLLAVAINAGVVALSLAGAWLVIRMITRGVGVLRSRVVAMGKALPEPADSPGPITEIRDLASAIREMAALRREAVAALRESEEQFRAFFDNAGVGIVQIDLDGRYVRFNDRYCQIVGYSRQELQGRDLMELVHPEDRQEDRRKIMQYFRGQVPQYDVEKRYVRKDGRVVWAHVTASLVRGPGGEVLRTAAIVEDITERKQAELERLRSEALYRSISDQAAESIFLTDEQGRVTFANPEALKVFGFTSEELVGRVLHDAIHHHHTDGRPYPVEECPLAGVRASRQVVRDYEDVFFRKDGTMVPVVCSTAPLDSLGRSGGAVLLVRDVTQRKRAQEQLKHAVEELARSNRDLAQFAAAASHDLQEPLRTVQGHLGIVEHRLGGKLDDATRQSMQFAVDGAARMEALIRDLLAYSRVGRSGKEPVATDMEAVLAEALAALRAALDSAGATVSHEPLPTIQSQPSLMAQLLQNLLGNAIKYRAKDKKPEIHVGARREPQAWTFWVLDNGIGIRPQDAERVFVIFQRLHTRQEYPGTGVGLAICKRIVESQGGRIWVESKPDQGAAFFFTIPDRC